MQETCQRIRQNDQKVVSLIVGEDKKVGDYEYRQLAEVLGKNTTLTSLSLRSSGISPVTARVFSEALKENRTLLSFSIASSNFSEPAVKYLARSLLFNSSLTHLLMHQQL